MNLISRVSFNIDASSFNFRPFSSTSVDYTPGNFYVWIRSRRAIQLQNFEWIPTKVTRPYYANLHVKELELLLKFREVPVLHPIAIRKTRLRNSTSMTLRNVLKWNIHSETANTFTNFATSQIIYLIDEINFSLILIWHVTERSNEVLIHSSVLICHPFEFVF